jgi:glycosyltransferase involved in cell wall biosynthesis
MSNISDHSLITVCIPAYNRAKLLAPLLESIFSQAFDDFDVLICEDGSPEREAIAVVVRRFQQLYPGRIQYEENPANLGYDGNIRRLTELASGRYCLFMGNDDLLCEGALASIAASIAAHPECGVVVRSYASFEGDPAHHKQVFRYFPQEYVLPAGVQAVATAYRRSVVISGMALPCGNDTCQARRGFLSADRRAPARWHAARFWQQRRGTWKVCSARSNAGVFHSLHAGNAGDSGVHRK